MYNFLRILKDYGTYTDDDLEGPTHSKVDEDFPNSTSLEEGHGGKNNS